MSCGKPNGQPAPGCGAASGEAGWSLLEKTCRLGEIWRNREISGDFLPIHGGLGEKIDGF